MPDSEDDKKNLLRRFLDYEIPGTREIAPYVRSAMEGASVGTIPRVLGDEYRDAYKQAVNEHPYVNFAGGMASPSPFGKAKTGQKLGAALLSSMGRGAAAGGLAGGVRGLTSTPEDSSAVDYMKNAATGALEGGAAGAVISPALTGIGRGLSWAARKAALHSIAPFGLPDELQSKSESIETPPSNEFAQRAIDEKLIPWFGTTRNVGARFRDAADVQGEKVKSALSIPFPSGGKRLVSPGIIAGNIERVAESGDYGDDDTGFVAAAMKKASDLKGQPEMTPLGAWSKLRVPLDRVTYPTTAGVSPEGQAKASVKARNLIDVGIREALSPEADAAYVAAKKPYGFLATGRETALSSVKAAEGRGLSGGSPDATGWRLLLGSAPTQVASSLSARSLNPMGKLTQNSFGPMSKATGSMLVNSLAPPGRGPSTSDPGYTFVPDDEEAPASKGYTFIPD